MAELRFFAFDTSTYLLKEQSIEIEKETNNFFFLRTSSDIYVTCSKRINKDDLDKIQISWRYYCMTTVCGDRSTFIAAVITALKNKRLEMSDKMKKISDCIGLLSEMTEAKEPPLEKDTEN